jgi:hypothetical protein
MNLKENIRKVLREEVELNPTKRVYDYDKERDTVPERLPFDIDKLVDSGVVFVTPAIDGDPNSKTYKKWLEEPYVHLLTLYNVDHSSEDGWIKKAITKVAPTEQYKNFVDKIYDGKYNQILWGLEKLGINPMDMLIDTNIQENIRRVVREEKTNPKENPVKYYYYNYLNENPIEFEGLFLVPKWTGLQIKWKVKNPNDYSYSKTILTQVLHDEFKSFCDMTNTDFNKYKHFASWMKNIRNNCYVSVKDRERLNDNGKQIKHIDFSGVFYRYEFDFDYETTHVTTNDPEVEVYVYGNITNLRKTNLKDNLERTLEKVKPKHFIGDMTDTDYDEWKEELHNILHPMYNIFVNNPRFYNNEYDYFELGLQQVP